MTIENNFSGAKGGLRKSCTGKTDINAISRPISSAEMKFCNDNTVRYIELPIAFDAITVVAKL
ncbi:MAG: hypothetical protein ACTMUB_07885 [cyanobacterium endosymbiont of Rhopalodia musculus]|uniref:hypothetical protein n=1 Tax=cyanobacterium endosymbiont of Epithemia clementina EcSB TaxID=3034674 RepID=UPI00386AFB02